MLWISMILCALQGSIIYCCHRALSTPMEFGKKLQLHCSPIQSGKAPPRSSLFAPCKTCTHTAVLPLHFLLHCISVFPMDWLYPLSLAYGDLHLLLTGSRGRKQMDFLQRSAGRVTQKSILIISKQTWDQTGRAPTKLRIVFYWNELQNSNNV